MIIGIASPISCYYFQKYLNPESALIASRLSNHDGPAVTNLVLTFLKKGHSVVVFTKDPETDKGYKLIGDKLTIYVVPSIHKGWRRLLNKLLITDLSLIFTMWFSHEKVDVMSVHWTRDYAFGARKYLSLCPVTVTVRDIIPIVSRMQPIRWSTKIWNEITMREHRFHFISNSDYTKEMVKKLWDIDSCVIYNGISELFLDYQYEDKYNIYTYICISTAIDDRKNINNLLIAFNFVHKKQPQTQLLLIGPCFEDENSTMIKWKEQGLCQGVKLMGKKNRSEVKTLLTKSHCLVHPSREESFGNILIEAMACKCLTIGGKDSGAVPYVLKHGDLGLLCDVNDSNSIADAMIHAYQGNYEPMIEKAYEVVHSEYSPNKVSDDYLHFFEEIVKG